jgi:hypothetical protein
MEILSIISQYSGSRDTLVLCFEIVIDLFSIYLYHLTWVD